MTNLNIYTYFDVKQMSTLLKFAQDGTRSLVKHINRNYPNDAQAIFEAMADCMPNLVAEDRKLSRGPRKGLRVITFYDLPGPTTEQTVAFELTGVTSWSAFYKQVEQYAKEESMTLVVLDDTRSRPDQLGLTPYKKHWVWAFLTRQDNSRAREHYKAMTVQCIADTQKAVDAFINEYDLDIDEIMTWDGKKYNEWYFADKKASEEAA
jgi:hypothetical protein